MTLSRPGAMLLAACCSVFVILPFCFSQPFPESSYQALRWRMVGPFRGGRTRAVSGVPNQPNVFYIGQVNGGVWKSDDYGRTWVPIFDSQPTQSIGAIAVAPSDPNVIYVSSGEGLHRPDLSVGDGIYKSRDGGKTWTHLGLREGQQIPALVVDPRDPDKLVAAVLGHPYGASAERGIYRSTDGGNTWKKVLYKDENTGGSMVVMDPSNPDILYAGLWEAREGPWEDNNTYNGTGGGLFKSTDGGETWRPLTRGLPANLVQVNVAVAPSEPQRLYATLATTDRGERGSGAGLGVYRSDDGGENWYHVTTDPRAGFRIGGGDLPIPKVDPGNPDVVYTTSIVTMKSTDGGKSWVSFRGAPGGDDYQNIWINPNDSNVIILVSDQGAIVTVNGGQTWSSWYNQPTAQLYHVATTNTFPYRVCAGQQESGSVCIASRGNDGQITFRDWHPVGVIEYGYVAPDPLDSDVIYGAGRSEVSKYRWSTGQVENVTPIPVRGKYRTNRTQPIMFSPLDPHVMYYAANVLFKTSDGGQNWETISPDLTRENPGPPPSVGKLFPQGADQQRGVIYALAPSFKTMDTLWAGTDDGLVWITRDGGKNWSNITPPELTPWSKVTQISASHFDDETAFISVSRFRIDDLRPYMYRTHDGGKSWKPITEGLPSDAPVDTVREDPERKGLLFAGTEKAVWMSFDSGDHWQSLQQNLPHTSMRDLWIHENDLIVATHGRGFWILDNITPLRQLTDAVVNSDYLFRPALAYRVRRDTNPDTPIPPDEPTAQNPPNGAMLDYHLAKAASGTVTLEILDSHDKLVRRFSSADQPEVSQEELEKQLVPLYWVRMPKAPSTEAGMHRWVWDLHYPAPASTQHEYPIAAIPGDTPREPLGPHALPGKYTVRLTVNGHSYTRPLTVEMDPRVKTPLAGLEQLFQVETRLRSLLTRTSVAVAQARSLEQQVQALSAKASGPAGDALKAFREKLAAVLEGMAQPAGSSPAPGLNRVNGAAATLYADATRSDAAPTTALLNATSAAEQDSVPVLRALDNLKTTDLPALNQVLRGTGLPGIQWQTDSTKVDDQGDIE